MARALLSSVFTLMRRSFAASAGMRSGSSVTGGAGALFLTIASAGCFRIVGAELREKLGRCSNPNKSHQSDTKCAISYRPSMTATGSRGLGHSVAPSTGTCSAIATSFAATAIARALLSAGRGWASASVGATTAFCRDEGTTRMPERLLLAADKALYKAKPEGRNRVAIAMLVAPKTD